MFLLVCTVDGLSSPILCATTATPSSDVRGTGPYLFDLFVNKTNQLRILETANLLSSISNDVFRYSFTPHWGQAIFKPKSGKRYHTHYRCFMVSMVIYFQLPNVFSALTMAEEHDHRPLLR